MLLASHVPETYDSTVASLASACVHLAPATSAGFDKFCDSTIYICIDSSHTLGSHSKRIISVKDMVTCSSRYIVPREYR